MRIGIALFLVACASGHKATPDAAPVVAHTPNQFLTAGPVTFVVGTQGDDLADRAVAAQVALIQPRLKGSDAIADTAMTAWPARPVVYGGPHINAAVANLTDLPFQLTPGHLAIGGETFDGDDVRLITVVPATKAHPELLLYAGTGNPGIAEINALPHADAVITIADRFGVLRTGTWTATGAKLDPPHRRVDWRTVERTVDGTPVHVHYVTMLKPADGEGQEVDAIAAGVAQSQQALGIRDQPAIDVYVYPDPASKKELAGNADSGTAVVEARTFHTITAPPAAMVPHIAHEATHLLAYRTWGPSSTSLFGEGIAVWAAGAYGGKTLDQWKPTLTTRPTIPQIMSNPPPEPTLYPLGGLLVRVIVEQLGAAALKDHFLGATAATWADACKAAGTTPEALEAALDAELHS